MRVLLYGASGMVGQGVLREALLAPDVQQVTAVSRRPLGVAHPKLLELVLPDVGVLGGVEGYIRSVDACFFCVGATSVGASEEEFRRVTYDLTLRVAKELARVNPGMVYVYVSGAGTDTTETGPRMWARVKGATENALRRLPFRAVYLFRPGIIRPRHGIRSRTRAYRIAYALLFPFIAVVALVAPDSVTSTDLVGRAMLEVVRHGASSPYVETRDINRLARGVSPP